MCIEESGESFVERFRLAIVGAGVSGLVCANTLVDQYGWSVDDIVLLEARKRVGGRVLTTQEEGSFYYDHGAAWVHGTMNNPMLELFEEKGENELIPLVEGNPWTRPMSVLQKAGKMTVSMDGRIVTPEHVEEAINAHFTLLQEVSDLGSHLFNNGDGMVTTQWSLYDAIQRTSSNEALSGYSTLSRTVAPLFLHFLECWNGASAKELQMCEFIADEGQELHGDEAYNPAGDWPGPHCVPRRGMASLLEPLLRKNLSIRLDHEVTNISRTRHDSIRLLCRNGQSVDADASVVTIPAGCLPKVVDAIFEEGALSVDKREAISRLEAGTYKKVFLTFSDIQWPPDPPFLGLVWNNTTSPLGNYMIVDNLWARSGIPSLEVIMFGSSGEWATGKSTRVIQQHVVTFLESALGYSLGTVESCHVTRWEEDPFSQGAYSHTPLGALEKHKEELREPEWHHMLYFAGEATNSEYEGSVHAAIISGRETAQQIAHNRKFDEGSDVVSDRENKDVYTR